VAGRTANEAVKRFSAPIQRALTCFADGRVSADSSNPADEGVLSFNKAEYVKLNGPGRVRISIGMRYRIVPNEDQDKARLPWKVHTTSYAYSLHDARDKPIVDYHWHPHLTPDILFPHLHIDSLPKRVHFSTGRVLIEHVLRLAVECGAQPLNPDNWKRTLRDNLRNFEKSATWGNQPPG
jgi:hypothetical protein